MDHFYEERERAKKTLSHFLGTVHYDNREVMKCTDGYHCYEDSRCGFDFITESLDEALRFLFPE